MKRWAFVLLMIKWLIIVFQTVSKGLLKEKFWNNVRKHESINVIYFF